MVDGLAPHIAYYPVAALAALTAALVTLLVAVGAWRKSIGKEDTAESESDAQLEENATEDLTDTMLDKTSPPPELLAAYLARERSSEKYIDEGKDDDTDTWSFGDEDIEKKELDNNNTTEDSNSVLSEGKISTPLFESTVSLENSDELSEVYGSKASSVEESSVSLVQFSPTSFHESLISNGHDKVALEHRQLRSTSVSSESAASESNNDLSSKEHVCQSTARQGRPEGPLDQLQKQAGFESANCDVRFANRELPTTGDRDSSPEKSVLRYDHDETKPERPSITGKTKDLVSTKTSPKHHLPNNRKKVNTFQFGPDNIWNPLNTAFYLYDMTAEMAKWSRLAITDKSLLTTVDTMVFRKSLPEQKTHACVENEPEETNELTSADDHREENTATDRTTVAQSLGKPVDEIQDSNGDVIDFNTVESKPESERTSRDVGHISSRKEKQVTPVSDNEENEEMGRSSFSAGVGEEQSGGEAAFKSKIASERDNSAGDEEETYSCFPSPDVTSGAVHYGTARAVQGSWREELIEEEACSECSIAAETRSKGVYESPACYGRTTIQMADVKAGSCANHDSEVSQAITDLKADRFGRLDELANHLRQLAADSDGRCYGETAVIPEREKCTVNTRGDDSTDSQAVGVGLLLEYYNENTYTGSELDRRGKSDDCFFSSDLGGSDASNYGSDSSQSLCLSSYNGDTGSSFSSCPNSPKSGHKDIVHPTADNTFKSLAVETKQRAGEEQVTPSDNYEECPRKGTNSLPESVSRLVSGRSTQCESTPISVSSSTSSLLDLESAVRESSAGFDRSLLDTMEDSSRRLRLQKLLERDKERKDRLKLLTGSLGPKDQSTVAGCDPRSTLGVIETAIGHMQQLIQPQESESAECYDDKHEMHVNEHHSSEKTMGCAEVRLRSSVSLDSCPVECQTKHNENNSHFGEGSEVESSDEGSYNHQHPPEDQTHQDEVEDWEILMQNVLDNISNYRTCEEEITGSMGKCSGSGNEFVTVESSNRWRLHSPAAPLNERSADDWKLDIESVDKCTIEAGKRHFEKTDVQKVERKSTHHYSSISQKTELTINSSGGEESECRWSRRDVTEPAAQSPLRSSGAAERSARAAKTSPPSFSNDLREEPVHRMESGGCEMEQTISSSPPPPAPTANAATNTTPTPTKIKNLRFKLDPDIYDLPSENGYYGDDDDYNRRPGWKKQPKYHTFSSLELGRGREPVKVVSVRTSVVPAGTKMVVKPVCVSEGQPSSKIPEIDDSQLMVKKLDIDLRIRLETQEQVKEQRPANETIVDVVRGDWRASPDRQPKRSYLSSSPAQSKRRSPIPDFSGWNQSLSPVSENCDWVAVPSTSPEYKILSTSSDPGQRGKMFSTDESVHSFSYDDLKLTGSSDNEPGRVPESDSDQQTDLHATSQSRNAETLNQSTDILDSKDCSVNPFEAVLTSTPSRPSTLELNHFRKNLQSPRKKFVPDPEAVERITGFRAAEEKSTTKPPLPPAIRSMPSAHRMSSGAKNRIDQLRKRYLDSKYLMAAQKLDSSAKFEKFLNSAQEDRAKLATSTPDLAAFEAAVRSQWAKARSESAKDSNTKENSPPPPPEATGSVAVSRSTTPDEVWVNYVQLLRRQLNRRSQSMSYLETDVDAFFAEDKSRSMTTLERSPPNSTQSLAMPSKNDNRVGTNLEESDRTKSEHELRIEKSLQDMNLPEWYKHSQRPKSGFILNKKSDEKRGWAAVKSLTSSTTNLVSGGNKPRRPARSLRTSQENLMWSRGSASPASADNSFSRIAKTTNGTVLSLALARAFREPYVGWRARTPSSCATPSPQVDCSPPSWVVMDNTDRSDTPLTSDLQAMDEEEDTGLSFDGEDVLEDAESSNRIVPMKVNGLESPLPSADDTCNDIINISMDTCDHASGQQDDSKSLDLPGEDTCDDIKNITMDTFELFPPNANDEHKTSPVGDDTCDDVLNISTDTSSQVNPVLNGNHGTSSVMGVTEDTGLDIDDISTDTSNMALSQPIANGNRELIDVENHFPNGNHESSFSSNLNETDQSFSNRMINDNCERPPHHLVNGDRRDDPQINGNSNVYAPPHINGNTDAINLRNAEPPFPKFEPKAKEDCNKLDTKRKRYSYNRSIYQSELDGSKTRNLDAPNKGDFDGSTQSLPDEQHNPRDVNKVIWIESSFVGSRTTTSIVVLPTDNVVKDGCKGSTGSNSSVGRPASR